MTAISDKIKKLLNLAQSSNENEAKAAANMAQRLMVKHNLTSVNLDSCEYDDSVIAEYARASVESKYVHDLISKFFFVNVVTVRSVKRNPITYQASRVSEVTLFGTSENIEIAGYTYQFLSNSFKRLWKQYQLETGATASSKQSYMLGLWRGITSQLKESRQSVEQETGLVVVKDHGIAKYQQSKIGRTQNSSSKVSARDSSATASGTAAGKNLRISRGIGSSHSGKVLAIG